MTDNEIIKTETKEKEQALIRSLAEMYLHDRLDVVDIKVKTDLEMLDQEDAELEIILQELPHDKVKVIHRYIDRLSNALLAVNEKYYKAGFEDGKEFHSFMNEVGKKVTN